MIYRLSKKSIHFPSALTAEGEDDVVALGGDASVERLLEAYTHGIFPWPMWEEELMWVSTNPRFVLYPEDLHIPKSLRRTLKKHPFRITVDACFDRVIRACRETERPQQDGTWITQTIVDGYIAFHKAGYAHSVEAWIGNELVGGLYGVAIGHIFCGESMFAAVSDASKCAFATLAQTLFKKGINLIDCQAYTDNLARFGAREIPRSQYLDALKIGLLDGVDSCISWPTLAQEIALDCNLLG